MNVLIADDEALARERLRRLLSEVPACHLVGEACDGDEALAMSDALRPDVLILDVRMPGLDGLQLAHRLAERDPPPAVIFCTAHAEHALHAFQTIATAYLLKPVTRVKLRAALEKVSRSTRAHQPAAVGPMFLVGRPGVQRRIPLARLLCLRAEDKLTTVVHEQGVDYDEQSLNQWLARFPQLLRIHRKTVINPAQVRVIERDSAGHTQVLMAGLDEPLPVSRRLLARVRARLAEDPGDDRTMPE
ncbi:MAG: LytTR family DNA-binding domain-containing protein [Oceanococcaceae bacterium]